LLDDVSALLGAAGVAWAAVWLVAVAVAAVALRPERPPTGPAVSELGPESPAVVNLLAHRFEPTPEAVPAVVLDLAARRVLEIIELPGGEQHVLHVPETTPPGLSDTEQRVLSHLQRKAIRGVVPAPAMTTGPEDASAAWWRGVRKATIAEAQAAGLCRRRWAGARVRLLELAALGPLALGGLGNLLAEEGEESAWVVAGVSAGFACALLAAALVRSDRQRETPAGLAAASRWLGVGAHLGETDRYAHATPGSVVLDGRYLSYACALGLAPVCVARLPLGHEDDREAWSHHGGRWRPVRVRYPRFAAGWGRHPASAALLGLVLTVAGAWPLAILADADLPRWALAAAAVVLVPVAARGLLLLVRGVLDLGDRVVVEGLVVRARRREVGSGDNKRYQYWVAVDDGTSSRIRAWRVRPALYTAAPQDSNVRVVVTRRLGYVREVGASAPWGPPDVSVPPAPPRSAPR